MNYEDELQLTLIHQLKEQYGILEETALFHYLTIRCYISRNGKAFTKYRETKEFVHFLCDELKLPAGDSFIYKGEKVEKGVALINSLENVIESWKFECSIREVVDEKGIALNMDKYLEKQQAKIHRYANNKSKPFKNTSAYEWHWKHHALNQLNTVYKATPSSPRKVEGVHYDGEHGLLHRTMEEVAEAWVHANTYVRMDTKTIAEQDVEKYLYSRLELIEEGLTYVDRQVTIQDGRIDILAKDKEGTFVIIELKVVEDKELVWQCMYYPMQIKKMYGLSHVRMMTLAPEYSYSLRVTLEQLGYVEMKSFTPKVRLGKIESIMVNPLCQLKAA